MRFNMLFTICPAENLEDILDGAKLAGVTGATILNVRGTGSKEAKTFFGLTLDRPQEAMVMLVERHLCSKVMKAVYSSGGMKEPGNGICFSMPIDSVVGLESQLAILKKKTEELL